MNAFVWNAMWLLTAAGVLYGSAKGLAWCGGVLQVWA